MEVIVLAGGLGTRLGELTRKVPKPMLDVSGRPFLAYIFEYLSWCSASKVVLSVGYQWDVIKSYFGNSFNDIRVEYSVEQEPLGTGGAILKALELVDASDVLILNGDTLAAVDLRGFHHRHFESKSLFSMAVTSLPDVSRYGRVFFSDDLIISGFGEKESGGTGWINCGAYLLNKALLNEYQFGEAFSFENDLLSKYVQRIRAQAFPFEGYFLDIGIPSDYERAQVELPNVMRDLKLTPVLDDENT